MRSLITCRSRETRDIPGLWYRGCGWHCEAVGGWLAGEGAGGAGVLPSEFHAVFHGFVLEGQGVE